MFQLPEHFRAFRRVRSPNNDAGDFPSPCWKTAWVAHPISGKQLWFEKFQPMPTHLLFRLVPSSGQLVPPLVHWLILSLFGGQVMSPGRGTDHLNILGGSGCYLPFLSIPIQQVL